MHDSQTRTAGKDLQENNMLKPRHIMALGGVSALLFAFAPAAMASGCTATGGPPATCSTSVNVYGNVGAGSLSINPLSVTNVSGNPATNNGLANTSATPWLTTLATGGNTSASYQEVVGAYDNTGSGAGWNATITSTEYTSTTGATVRDVNSPNFGQVFEFGASGDSSLAGATDEVSTLGTIAGVNAPGSGLGNDSYLASPGSTGLAAIPQGGALVGTEPTAVPFYDAAVGTGMGDFNLTLPVSVVIPADAYAGTYESTQTLAIVSGP